jgi:hypothetical protein
MRAVALHAGRSNDSHSHILANSQRERYQDYLRVVNSVTHRQMLDLLDEIGMTSSSAKHLFSSHIRTLNT